MKHMEFIGDQQRDRRGDKSHAVPDQWHGRFRQHFLQGPRDPLYSEVCNRKELWKIGSPLERSGVVFGVSNDPAAGFDVAVIRSKAIFVDDIEQRADVEV